MNNKHVSSKFWIPLLLGLFVIAIGCHPSQTVDSVVIKKENIIKVCYKFWLPLLKGLLVITRGEHKIALAPEPLFSLTWFPTIGKNQHDLVLYYLESLLLRTIWTSVWEKKWYWWFMIATCLKIRFGSLNAQNSW